jgi:hypothetical protein
MKLLRTGRDRSRARPHSLTRILACMREHSLKDLRKRLMTIDGTSDRMTLTSACYFRYLQRPLCCVLAHTERVVGIISMAFHQNLVIKVFIRLLQLAFASIEFAILCTRLRAYTFTSPLYHAQSDTPSAILTISTTVGGISIVDGAVDLSAICATRTRTLACVIDVSMILLGIGASIVSGPPPCH